MTRPPKVRHTHRWPNKGPHACHGVCGLATWFALARFLRNHRRAKAERQQTKPPWTSRSEGHRRHFRCVQHAPGCRRWSNSAEAKKGSPRPTSVTQGGRGTGGGVTPLDLHVRGTENPNNRVKPLPSPESGARCENLLSTRTAVSTCQGMLARAVETTSSLLTETVFQGAPRKSPTTSSGESTGSHADRRFSGVLFAGMITDGRNRRRRLKAWTTSPSEPRPQKT